MAFFSVEIAKTTAEYRWPAKTKVPWQKFIVQLYLLIWALSLHYYQTVNYVFPKTGFTILSSKGPAGQPVRLSGICAVSILLNLFHFHQDTVTEREKNIPSLILPIFT